MASGPDDKRTDADPGFIGRMRIAALLAGNGKILAERTGISRRAIAEYLAGNSEPNRPRLLAIAEAAGVSVEWLATGRDAAPVVGLAACGLEGWFEERRLGLSAEAPADAPLGCFAVIATGESMIPAGINPGDLVFVDPNHQAQPGQKALVELNDRSAAIKVFGGRDGEWGVLQGWVRDEAGEPLSYVDRRRWDQIHRLLPVVAIRPGLASLAETPIPAEPASPPPGVEDFVRLMASTIKETLEFIDRMGNQPTPEPTAELCTIAMRLMLAPELASADDQTRMISLRRSLKAMEPAIRKPLWTP